MDDIVEQTQELFSNVAETIKSKDKTTREIFRGKIYTVPIPDENLTEVEVIRFKDLVSTLNHLNSDKLSEDLEQMLILVLQQSKLAKYQLILLEDVNQIMASFNLVERMPKSRKGLQYEQLDMKSKRILNRIVEYLREKDLTTTDFVQEITSIKTVKYNNNKSAQMEIIKAENFFKKLCKVKIRKSHSVYQNLSAFLAISP